MQLLALFDLDNTLIDRQCGLEEWARDFSVTRALLPHAERLIGDALRERAYPADFERLRDCLGLADSVDSLWSEYVAGMAARARCRAGLHSDLRRMRAAGWTLGVITNGATDIQRAKVENAGLSALVDGVCVSEEVGVRKPSVALFQAAAARCGATLAEGGWMVGDNVETDIEGGRSAGLRTVWIAAGRQWPADVRSPDLMAEDASAAIGSLTEWGTYSEPQSCGSL
ncbi:HAD family hydrolase [Streptomyces sp. ISL-98]|uniref:HAD family hydrolase n=1 Tax=Streptomyces sp. ISL-98 TaxID=2819192 RepID=UPI001BE987B3|nr:HAD family hydrolase [Streptomyces sp. ISL-98]MBT2507505.1 HAD family hydrolase [Streptomyces sp. ISL-98]